MTTKVVWARKWPVRWLDGPSIFLAGPTPRDVVAQPSWRPEAIDNINSVGFDGHVFVPEDESWGLDPKVYEDQVLWEWDALEVSTVIAFWIPRELRLMPGFTTNTEVGMVFRQTNVVYGWPDDAAKMGYIDMLVRRRAGCTPHKTLRETMRAAVYMAEAIYSQGLLNEGSR